ncbi:hypothetical protein BD324DRAFT_614014 [Kockovaella imperatae]|uniref:Kinetochore protein Spc24 n=1 Tax=Kockovaella imperatae TaxID=4999 RepID=A0A1Y1UUZ3_9TREE|nr:hypothetical protein BD324DRAFT_614014 [Kockovaella imperatae]ORX41296.1 hypothetical protein BD324DRAFT_614014 [Kockovaella imperatae]
MATAVVGFPSVPMMTHTMDVDMEGHEPELGDRSYAESNRSAYLQENQWTAYIEPIKDTVNMLNPDEELQDLEAAESAFGKIEEEREAMLQRLENEVNELAKQYEAAAQDAVRPKTLPPVEEHLAQVRDLERQQVSLGKSINEEQAKVVGKETELRDLKTRKDQIVNVDVGAEMAPDSKAARLKLLSDMGFTYIPGQGSSSSKILIRNEAKLDVHTVALDNKRAKAYYANVIWSMLGDKE